MKPNYLRHLPGKVFGTPLLVQPQKLNVIFQAIGPRAQALHGAGRRGGEWPEQPSLRFLMCPEFDRRPQFESAPDRQPLFPPCCAASSLSSGKELHFLPSCGASGHRPGSQS